MLAQIKKHWSCMMDTLADGLVRCTIGPKNIRKFVSKMEAKIDLRPNDLKQCPLKLCVFCLFLRSDNEIKTTKNKIKRSNSLASQRVYEFWWTSADSKAQRPYLQPYLSIPRLVWFIVNIDCFESAAAIQYQNRPFVLHRNEWERNWKMICLFTTVPHPHGRWQLH